MSVRWSDRLSSLGDALVEVARGQGIEPGLLATLLVAVPLDGWPEPDTGRNQVGPPSNEFGAVGGTE